MDADFVVKSKMKNKWIRDLIIKLILGLYPKRANFQWIGLIPAAIVIILTYFIIGTGHFFEIIDNLIDLSNQPCTWDFQLKALFYLLQ